MDSLLGRIAATPAEVDAYRTLLIERTWTVAGSHPIFWRLAGAFAAELLIHDNANQVAAIVAEVNGDVPPHPER